MTGRRRGGNAGPARPLSGGATRKRAGRGVLELAAMGPGMAGSQGRPADRHRHHPDHQPGICPFSQRYPPGYRPGADGPERGVPRQGPPVWQHAWARWAFLAAIAAAWILALWVLL